MTDEREHTSEGHRPRNGNDRNHGPRSGEGRGYGRRDGHSSGPRRSGERGGDRGYRPERRDGPRGEGERSGGDRPRRYSDREGGRSEGRGYRSDRRDGDRPRRSGDRPYGDRPRREGYGDRPRREGHEDRRRPVEEERPRITVPSTVTEILHKGIDCEENGRNDLAMVLYLHGASMLNGGCEKRLAAMLGEAGPDQFGTIRGRLAKDCPAEIMPVFEYICSTIVPGHDVSPIRASAEEGNIHAISCLIRMNLVEADDPMVDVFAGKMDSQTEIVRSGLNLLVRRRKSEKAERYLKQYDDRQKLRSSIRSVFAKCMGGYESYRKDLSRLAGEFPEAKFLMGYLDAVKEDRAEQYLKDGMRENERTILSYLHELRLSKTPYSQYLRAKKTKNDGGQWVPLMVESAKDGCDEAMRDLGEMLNRREVRKALESYYLAKGDIGNLVLSYDEKDATCLDKYCDKDPVKILDVGERLGGMKQIDWLRKCCLDGCAECREALIEISRDRRRYGKPLLYALHDSGADIRAAEVFFDMGDDPSVPSVKWLAKVCRNEEAKEYVRSRFEQMGDLETFESIFEDDGYVPRSKMKQDRGSRGRRRY